LGHRRRAAIPAHGRLTAVNASRPDAYHFLTKRLPNVRTEMSLQVLAYNLKRVMQIMGVRPLIAAMRA
jgi:hypothetical protein